MAARKPKNYPAAQALIDKAMKVDPALAADIRAFARSREYGLVFEHNRPEAMRLYGKPIAEGDVVHILPERGTAESEESHVEWNVLEIVDGIAHLQQVEDEDVTCEASLDDIVAVAEYDQPIYAGLRETGRVERGGGTLGDPGDKPYHVVINGENYHALEALEFCYAGKVDCIYIDPPYNTGAKDWKYNNDYVDGNDAYRHSKFLAWLERRLKLAKALLNPKKSALLVAIDEKECLRVGLLLEQVFSGGTIQMVTTIINPAGAIRVGGFSRVEEHLFVVTIGDAMVVSNQNTMLDDVIRKEENRDVSWIGLRRREPSSVRAARPNQFYPIYVNEETGFIEEIGDVVPYGVDRVSIPVPEGLIALWPLNSKGDETLWGLTPDVLRNNWKKGYVRIGNWNAQKKKGTVKYLAGGTIDDVENGDAEIIGRHPDGAIIARYHSVGTVPAKRVWRQQSHNAETYGTLLIKALIDRRFPFPKSLYAVEDALRFFVSDKPDALIVDFFAGSGTTAHATMRLNHQDGGHRRCISVTNNEVSEDEEKKFTKKGIRQGDEEWERYGIARYITWPRIKAAITGVTPDGDPIKGEYGIKTEEYQEVEGDVLDPETGKKIRGKFFKKAKVQSRSVPDPFPMADGFDENAVFFDLTYEDPDMVEFGMAFSEIAPLLWMRAGCKGRIIEQEASDFAVADNYAVLFNYSRLGAFAKAIEDDDAIETVFVVTDDDHRYANAKKMFPGRDVVRLYESYLHSFQIASEGALS